MAEITAQMVNDLRAKTGAGMMDCKKALQKVDGDMEKAVDELRKSGIAKAEKKASRTAKEGVVAAKVDANAGALLELLCETDFVAKNEKFRAFADECCARLLAHPGDGDVTESFAASEKERVLAMIATIGENIVIRRAVRWKGFCGSYLHMGGKVGVLVQVGDAKSVAAAKDIGMHITAFRPQYVGPGDVPAEVIAKEKEIAAAQMKDKPANIIEKVLPGKLEKFYSEVCLLRQPWLRDDKISLEKANPGVSVLRFVRWEVGEEV